MKRRSLIALFLLAIACGSPETQSTESAQETTSAPTTSSTAPTATEYDLQFIDAFDMMFVDMMIPHHKGALEMSRDALQKAQRQELKDFAQATIDKQEKEIAELEASRGLRNQRVCRTSQITAAYRAAFPTITHVREWSHDASPTPLVAAARHPALLDASDRARYLARAGPVHRRSTGWRDAVAIERYGVPEARPRHHSRSHRDREVALVAMASEA